MIRSEAEVERELVVALKGLFKESFRLVLLVMAIGVVISLATHSQLASTATTFLAGAAAALGSGWICCRHVLRTTR